MEKIFAPDCSVHEVEKKIRKASQKGWAFVWDLEECTECALMA